MEEQLKVKRFNIINLSRLVFLVAIFLTPFVFWVNNIHFHANLKLGLFFGATILVLILWSISRLKTNDFSLPYNLVALSIVSVLVVSLLSSVFSDNPFVSIFGTQLTVSSFAGLFLLFVAALLISSLFASKKSSYIATFVAYVSTVLVLLINLLYILLPFLPDLGFFLTNSANTIGKWSDLGVLSALVILISYLIIDTQKQRNLLKNIAWAGIVISVISAIIVSEIIIWVTLGVLSLVYLVYKIVISRQNKHENIDKNLPYAAIVVLLVSFIMILMGGLLSRFTDSWFQIVYTETKPGINSTMELSKNTIASNPILGVGENRFERAWQQYKPEGINLTNYWGVDFVYGYSYLLSVPAKNGILGTLAWLFFIVMIVWSAIKLLFKKSEDFISSKISIIHAFVALFFVLVLLMHVPSVTILILAFVFLGLFLGSLGRNGLYNSVKVSIDEKPKLGFLYIFIVIVLMIVSIYLVYMNSRQFVSTVLLERANYSLNQGDLNATRNNIVNSINFFATDMNLRSLSEYYQIEMGRLLQNQSLENQATVDAFRNLLTNTINASAAAINFDRNSYQNHVSLATVY
jgi:hypothetical protein